MDCREFLSVWLRICVKKVKTQGIFVSKERVKRRRNERLQPDFQHKQRSTILLDDFIQKQEKHILTLSLYKSRHFFTLDNHEAASRTESKTRLNSIPTQTSEQGYKSTRKQELETQQKETATNKTGCNDKRDRRR